MHVFEISRGPDGHINLRGRFDASQAERARDVFGGVDESCTVDFGGLDYISSAGLGILLSTQKRLSESEHRLKLVNMNKHIRDIFHIAGFDMVFEIE
jgi:anti-sigma B factor antagonist